VRKDVEAFVETAMVDGLLERVSTPRPSSHADGEALRLGRSALIDGASLAELKRTFASQHYARLPQLIDPCLLRVIDAHIDRGEFVDRQHDHIGSELCLMPGSATSALQLLFNDPALLEIISQVADCPVRCFDGRVYRMLAADGHYDSWHSDAGEDRRVALSLNLSPRPYEGGVLEIRDREATAAAHSVENHGFGNAVIFRISPDLRHRVTAVRGTHARTAYAGWFRETPDFQDLFLASLARP
jgi:hypothetical protein